MRFILVVAVMLAAPIVALARDYDCGDFSTQAEEQRGTPSRSSSARTARLTALDEPLADVGGAYEDTGPGDPYRLCETLP